ncbi:unnamed protein product [Lactuca virosa]|uniref:F-box domain-containing protein n=1 Tax=Lactuca virosa TaxID=75947 RepID=A0AAU9MGH1_9ASTR|nr:unnamed protein product [Lactuca virosa]
MKKSERPKALKREDGVDFISSMPDAILVLILSRLFFTKETIRSSILSRRWSMWTVGRWIHAAVTRNVKKLELTLSPNQNYEDIEMPHCLVTSGSVEVLELDLSRRGLKLPNIMGFPTLRVLELESVNLLEDDDLLKKLTIFNGNEDEGMCGSIKVSCPKLVHLDTTGHIAYNLYFECLDSLKEAAIDPELEGNIKSVLFPGISQVESLLTDVYFFSQCINAARDPSLPNLKTLSLKLVIKKQFYGREEWESHEGGRKRIMTPDLKSAEFFEFKGEKPKVSDWDEVRCLEMVFSWESIVSCQEQWPWRRLGHMRNSRVYIHKI